VVPELFIKYSNQWYY